MTAEQFIMGITPFVVRSNLYDQKSRMVGVTGVTYDGVMFAEGDLTGHLFPTCPAFVPLRLINHFSGSGARYYFPVVYTLAWEHFTPVEVPNGLELRTADEGDSAWLIRWTQQHNVEAKHQTISEKQAYAQIERLLQPPGKIYVLYAAGEPVSLHARTGEVEDVAMISRGYTPLEYRGNGYAVQCLSLICEKLFVEGFNRLTWFTENENLWKRLNPRVWERYVDIRR